ncbi:hypothetical protein BU17DRAFT_100911 [Hysterangium stoloniferum]|nr:hypothetical protein BU17DRAFT_100911 [Hysterangium stoloniferum]
MVSRLSLTHSHSDSEDSDGAPEAISLLKSKKASRAKEQAVQVFESEQKAKRKRENREKDRALKEAKEKRDQAGTEEEHGERKAKKAKLDKRKGEASSAIVDLDTVEEMEHMTPHSDDRESDGDEDINDVGSGSEDGDGSEEEEWGGIDPANYLPDHLFSVAPTPAPPPEENITKSIVKTHSRRPKSARKKAKDLIVGSRTVRTMKPESLSTTPLTLPPARINKFLKRTLQLKKREHSIDKTTHGSTKKSTGKGKADNKSPSWERRAANIGVLRNANGPALKFVRGS